jgi:hypothetical protein|tara:strand:- start:576 stop:749 length:174 start_codon:yes stop_codon:yes gene_type:complete
MNITSAKYVKDLEGNNTAIQCTINGTIWCVLMNNDSTRYQEILRQVAAGTLTIADAD